MKTKDKLELLRKSELYLFHLDNFEWNNSDSNEELSLWFRTKNKNYDKHFEIFGQDGTGGLFTLWYPKGKDSNEEPLVVYFDSEGLLEVAASNLDEFLSTMATGINLFDFVFNDGRTNFKDAMDDEEEKAEAIEDHQKFVNFLKEKMNLVPAQNLDELKEKSERLSPLLQDSVSQFRVKKE